MYLNDTLIVDGDFTVQAGATLHVNPGGVLLIIGSLNLNRNIIWGEDGDNEGEIIVLGDLNVNPPGTFDNTGDTYVGGTINDPGGGITVGGTLTDTTNLPPGLDDLVDEETCNISSVTLTSSDTDNTIMSGR